jgi:cation/acetate symporter
MSQGLQAVNVWPLAFNLPGEGFQSIAKPYVQPFGAVGSLAFVLGTITIATGIAAAPWLLPRVAAAPGVYESRKALGWATVFFGIVLLTVSAFAVFLRDYALDAVMSDRVGPLPDWLAGLASAGFAQYDPAASQLSFAALRFDRDGVFFALPLAAGLPQSFVYLGYAGAIAASLTAAGATLISLASILSEDVVQGMSWEPASDGNRVWLTRGFVPLTAVSGVLLTLLAPTDPLRLVLWALSLTGASLFPVLALSIWWKRMTPLGAISGLVAGFVVAALAIFASEAQVIGIPSVISGILGLPAAVAATLIVSSLLPETSRHLLEVIRDIRVPGGQIIYDREMQRLQLRKHTRN